PLAVEGERERERRWWLIALICDVKTKGGIQREAQGGRGMQRRRKRRNEKTEDMRCE
ncbi:hypothetical protein CH063_10501, partial [Colletotrichum higginsianum]